MPGRICEMPNVQPATVTVLALLPLVGWSLYRRVKRMVGRQRLTRVRPWITVVSFPLLLALLAMTAFVPPNPQPLRLAWLASALVVGGIVALWGLKRTSFEAIGDGLFYTPDSRIGITISVLFVARIVYRLADLAMHGPPPPQDTSFALSPFTLGPVGLLSGYFMVYAAGLVRQRWRMLRAQRRAETLAN
jgi:uncharacterized membrane protein